METNMTIYQINLYILMVELTLLLLILLASAIYVLYAIWRNNK